MTVFDTIRNSKITDGALLLIGGILVVIATCLAFPEFVHGSPCLWDVFNDQVNYLTAARNLLEEGHLQASLIYPSLLQQENSYAFLYAPGTPAVFALSYMALGYGILAVVIPGILAYSLGGLAVWYAALSLYGRLAGLTAGLLYLAFPMHAAFLHTAMTEQLLSASCGLAMAIACVAKRPLFYWLATGTLLLAVLLRETALAFFVILAGLISIQSRGALRPALFAAPAFGLVVGAVLTGVLLSTRPSLLLANLLVDSHSAVYFDAFALDQIPANASAVFGAMGDRLVRNVEIFFSPSMLNPEEHVAIATMLLLLIVFLVRGSTRRDLFLLSVGLCGIVAVLLLGSSYKIEFFKGSRFLAFLWPACCIGVASMVPRLHSIGAVFAAILLVVSLLTTQSLSGKRAAVCRNWFEEAHRQEEILSAHPIGTKGTIAADDSFGLSWVLKNPGTRWAFLPDNIETFRLLQQRIELDLVALRSTSGESARLTAIRAEGYEIEGSYSLKTGRYLLLVPSGNKVGGLDRAHDASQMSVP